MPIVQVVRVFPVRHRHVATVLSVLVGVAPVRDVLSVPAFVHMVAVDAVNVAVVRVIGVVAVRERDVAAALAMGVLVTGVRGVLDGIRHVRSPPLVMASHLAYGH
jgi:hypothetical protein